MHLCFQTMHFVCHALVPDLNQGLHYMLRARRSQAWVGGRVPPQLWSTFDAPARRPDSPRGLHFRRPGPGLECSTEPGALGLDGGRVLCRHCIFAAVLCVVDLAVLILCIPTLVTTTLFICCFTTLRVKIALAPDRSFVWVGSSLHSVAF